jgi:hypothetical protein
MLLCLNLYIFMLYDIDMDFMSNLLNHIYIYIEREMLELSTHYTILQVFIPYFRLGDKESFALNLYAI